LGWLAEANHKTKRFLALEKEFRVPGRAGSVLAFFLAWAVFPGGGFFRENIPEAQTCCTKKNA